MKGINFSVSAGGILLFAALFFFDETGVFSAIVPAVAVHEAGHVLAIRLFGGRIYSLKLELTGLLLGYSKSGGAVSELITAAAGPLAGFFFAYAAAFIGESLKSEFLFCTAGISAVFSFFNLLPANPLDGGRIVSVLLELWLNPRHAEFIMLVLGLLTSILIISLGFWCAAHGLGIALAAAGFWIFGIWIKNIRERERVVVGR